MVATADHTDESLDHTVSEVLRSVHDRLKMNVVFVSEFVDGRRVFRQLSATDTAPREGPDRDLKRD